MICRASIYAALPMLLWTCTVPVPSIPAGCGWAPPLDPGSTGSFSIRVDGLDRQYRLHLPAGYDAGSTAPLVLAFHGYTETAEQMERNTQLSAHADAHGYIVVYPQATGFPRDDMLMTSWNDLACNASPGPEGPTCLAGDDEWDFCPPECGDCGACNWCSCHDDLAFVDALLDDLESRLCVDPGRVFATGFSNGGMFVHRLGCERADRFAAVAPVSGLTVRGFACAPSSALPILLVHGSADDVSPLDGRPSRFGLLVTPLSEMVDLWAGPASQDCDAAAAAYPTAQDGVKQWECSERPRCAAGSQVVRCTWDGGHAWPDDDAAPFATDVIWDFFQRHGGWHRSREANGRPG